MKILTYPNFGTRLFFLYNGKAFPTNIRTMYIKLEKKQTKAYKM